MSRKSFSVPRALLPTLTHTPEVCFRHCRTRRRQCAGRVAGATAHTCVPHATMQLEGFEFELNDLQSPAHHRRVLVHSHHSHGLQAWPAAVGTSCSAAFAAIAPVAMENALVSVAHGPTAPLATASAAVIPPAATAAGLPADASGSSSPVDEAEFRTAYTGARRVCAPCREPAMMLKRCRNPGTRSRPELPFLFCLLAGTRRAYSS